MNNSILLLALEAFSAYLLVLWAHSMRRRVGLGPFYALLGGITAIMSWMTDAGVHVQAAGITFMVGSTAFYTALLLGVFVVYVFDGPHAARIAILTVAGVSILVPLVAAVLHIQMRVSGHAPLGYIPVPSLRTNVASVLATVADLIFLAIAWEFLGRPLLQTTLWLRAYITLLGVMWLDVILFSTGAFAGTPGYVSIMGGTFLSRLVISLFAGPFLLLYLNWQNRAMGDVIVNRPILAILQEVAEGRTELDVAREEMERRKRAEEALRRSEEKYRTLFEDALNPIVMVDEQGQYLDANQAALEFLECDLDELLTKRVWDYMPPGLLEEQKRTHAPFVSHRILETTYAVGGRTKALLLNIVPLTPNGQTILYGIGQDITDRKATEEALRRSEERYRLLAETTRDIIILHDMEGRILYMNQAGLANTGLRQSEAASRYIQEFVAAEDLEDLSDRRARRASGDEEPYRYETELVNLSGERIPVDVDSTPIITDGDVSAILLIARDITDRRRAEAERASLQEQLFQAQKMESVGRLAGGVAHDFNNMLGAILGHAEMAMLDMDPADPLYQDLQEIQRAAQRSANLTRQLLAFARKQTIAPMILDVNCAVEQTLNMLRRLIGEEIRLTWRPGADLWPVRMDPAQLDQVLVNLGVNSRDAISGRGEICVETENVTWIEADCAGALGRQPGEYVLLAVSDDGCGMDVSTQEHLFEPFFTTKPIGQGTGLGLATVYGMIKQNHGFVEVDSAPNQGTTVRVYLPRHVGHVESPPVEGPPTSIERGTETILVVEDEEIVLDMAKRMLERLGYGVLAASTPGEAAALTREHASRIQLLITDVVMPEIDGRELARQLRSLLPGMKVLLMSGYTPDVIDAESAWSDGMWFIQKPFSVQSLAAKVKEALDSG